MLTWVLDHQVESPTVKFGARLYLRFRMNLTTAVLVSCLLWCVATCSGGGEPGLRARQPLVGFRCEGGHHAEPDVLEDRVVVRQRVGIQQQAGRSDAPRGEGGELLSLLLLGDVGAGLGTRSCNIFSVAACRHEESFSSPWVVETRADPQDHGSRACCLVEHVVNTCIPVGKLEVHTS